MEFVGCYALVAMAILGSLVHPSSAFCNRGYGGHPMRLAQPRFFNTFHHLHHRPSWFNEDGFGPSMWSPFTSSFDVTPINNLYESDFDFRPERSMGCMNSRRKFPDNVDAIKPVKAERKINMLDEWEKSQLENFEKNRAVERKRFEEEEELERKRLGDTLKLERETLAKQYQHKMTKDSNTPPSRKSQNNLKGHERPPRFREFHDHHSEDSRFDTRENYIPLRHAPTRHEHRFTDETQHQDDRGESREQHSPNNHRFRKPPVTELASIHLPDYKPNEITVSLKGTEVTIKGHHECKCDESCVVTKFQRTYQLPRNVDLNSVEAAMSNDQVLKLTGHRSLRQPIVHMAAPQERQLPLVSNGVFVKERIGVQCPQSNPGIHIAKRDTRTGKMYVTKDSFVENRSDAKLVDDDIDDVTIETVEYE